jgi:iron complex outermembrane receptor protein
MLKSLLTTATLLALSMSAWAQFSISGTVRHAVNGEALAGATVKVEGQNLFASADAQGHFEIAGVPTGTYVVRVTFIGYAEKVQTVSVTANVTLQVLLEESSMMTDEVVVTATRANDKSPTTFTNVDKATIQKQNFGQDVPFILNWTPSVTTTSDAGAGVGYTSMSIRGSDPTRINVTVNGIPYNDAESQGTYWVDVPDVASSTQSIQIQRGVGTSTNGAGAFGASVNLQTNTRNDKPYADVINSYGSFNTHRHTVGFGTGLIDNRFVFDGRVSIIKSNGYIDRASSNLKSYYFAGGYYGKKTILKAIIFGGQEVTYQAWYGVPESRLNNNVDAMLATAAAEGWNADQTQNLLNSNSRTFNPYTYKNQTDNYNQDHYQLHFSHTFNSAFTANAALHYTYGRGYYEEYKYDDKFSNYGLPNAVVGGDTISSSDIIRRKWLRNWFYGTTYSVNYQKNKVNSTIGGAWNHYDGDHFGQVIWAKAAYNNIPNDYQYYFNNGSKYDFNVFWKTNYQLTDQLNGFLDMQYRRVTYHAFGQEDVPIDFNVKYNFFNPKLGLIYSMSQSQLYASYSVGNREPMRDDFVNAPAGQDVKHETLHNLEAGWKWRSATQFLNVNYYLMDYNNQLVLTGKLNDVGTPIRTNVDKSYREGIEVEGGLRLTTRLAWNANVTLSRNKIRNFTELLYDYGVNYDEYNEIQRQHKNTDISFSPNVIVGSILSYSIIKNVDLALLTKYVGKQYLDNTSDESRKINPYFKNDLRLTCTLHPARMREVTFSFLLNNVLDVKYVSGGYTYGYFGGGQETRQNYYSPQAGRNYLAMLALRF